MTDAKGPYLCILGGPGEYDAGSCGIEHETKADSTEHQKALRAAEPDVWTGASSATVEEVVTSRTEVGGEVAEDA